MRHAWIRRWPAACGIRSIADQATVFSDWVRLKMGQSFLPFIPTGANSAHGM
jgi:hypothetical protein